MQKTGMLKEVQMLPGAFDRVVNRAGLALGVGKPATARKADAQVKLFVTAITDGDTINILDTQKTEHKIRISGIDAPEKAQPFGSKSTANLGRLAFNKDAQADCPKRDRFGRLVCKVTVDGTDVGLQQVTDGMAWWYRKYAKEQLGADQDSYEQAETMAKLRRIGLWGEVNPVPPWEWRHK
jgi:endonuclease YncB( thermonuclease family)